MAFLQCEIRSDSIRMSTSLCVILPQDGAEAPRGMTLYLLHGRGQSAQAWSRYSRIESYAERYGIAVIMPEAGRSFYTDMRNGGSYFTYLTRELPEICGRLFHIPSGPDKTYIAGLSMGGYGALKCCFNRPDLYAGCAAFSSVTDIHWRLENTRKDDPGYRDLQGVFGEKFEPGREDDLFAMAAEAAKSPRRPRLFLTCGNEDVRLEQNLRLSELLRREGYDHAFQRWPGGHDWDFWETSIQKALEFFMPPR
ncbi:MAG: prolyl oligopeptidase family serine peptidase [Treponema sp.]|nr:prolyl oligopeptidase family serine peptidase [Treponema sp.]